MGGQTARLLYQPSHFGQKVADTLRVLVQVRPISTNNTVQRLEGVGSSAVPLATPMSGQQRQDAARPVAELPDHPDDGLKLCLGEVDRPARILPEPQAFAKLGREHRKDLSDAELVSMSTGAGTLVRA